MGNKNSSEAPENGDHTTTSTLTTVSAAPSAVAIRAASDVEADRLRLLMSKPLSDPIIHVDPLRVPLYRHERLVASVREGGVVIAAESFQRALGTSQTFLLQQATLVAERQDAIKACVACIEHDALVLDAKSRHVAGEVDTTERMQADCRAAAITLGETVDVVSDVAACLLGIRKLLSEEQWMAVKSSAPILHLP